MSRIIESHNLWQVQRLPPLPENVEDILAGLSDEQQSELFLALEIVRLIEKVDGTRRKIHGVNRAAQQRFPTRGIWIGLTETIISCWEMMGWIALYGAVLKPKIELEKGRFCFEAPHHVLQSLAVVAVETVGDQEEVFRPHNVVITTLVEGVSARCFRIAAETNLGTYKFAVMHHRVPEWKDLSHYCRWHTRMN